MPKGSSLIRGGKAVQGMGGGGNPEQRKRAKSRKDLEEVQDRSGEREKSPELGKSIRKVFKREKELEEEAIPMSPSRKAKNTQTGAHVNVQGCRKTKPALRA